MEEYENKPVQRLIDAYRDRYCYNATDKLLEALFQELSRKQVEKMIKEVNTPYTETKEETIEDAWWFAIR
jgi:hypothetical protein